MKQSNHPFKMKKKDLYKHDTEASFSQGMCRQMVFAGTSLLVATLCAPILSAQAADMQPVQARHPFIETLAVPATRIAAENGLYPSVMLAQAALESGWGESQLAAPPTHNLFGIKGDYQGQTTVMETFEDRGNQQYYTIDAGFRKYPSYSESLEDYAVVLKNGPDWDPTFYEGAWKSQAPTYQDATEHLTGRYATDSVYNQKLDTIITSHDLDWYDTATLEDVVEATSPASPSLSTPLEGGTYHVQAGDTLWQIAQEYGLTVSEIQAQNAITGSLIHPGQVLHMGIAGADIPVSIENEETETTVTQDQQPIARYTVASGDTLYRIASGSGVSVSELQEANGLTSDVIHPGQVLLTGNHAVEQIETDESSVMPQPGGAYTVQSGDTLYRIASDSGVSVSELQEANELTSDVIHPGQVLVTGNHAVEQIETDESSVMPQPGGAYTVQSGDTLYRIASDSGMSVSELQEANELTSDMIHPGQVLVTGNHAVEQIETDESSVMPQPGGAYTVQSGDTLYRIASNSGMSVSELQEANELTSDMIHPGQILVTGNHVVSVETNESSVTPQPGGAYTVQSGDTLYRIASDSGMSVSELQALNQLSSNVIQPGDVLITSARQTESDRVLSQPVVEDAIYAPSSTATHTVQSGETLYRIALEAGLSVAELKTWNQLDSDYIVVGQTLEMGQPDMFEQPDDTAISRSTTHTVKQGDTLYALARVNGVSVAQLMTWNDLTRPLIYPGQRLIVHSDIK